MPTTRTTSTAAPVVPHATLRAALLPFAPVLALAIVVAGYAVILRPRIAVLRGLRARAAVEREVADLEREVAALASARETFEASFASKREVIDAAVPGGEDVPGLFVALDAAAQHAGVLVTSMEVTREKAPTSLPSLRGNSVLLMNVAIRSVDYARLKSFLGILAESQRLMDVLSVQFSPQALTATIRLRAYTID